MQEENPAIDPPDPVEGDLGEVPVGGEIDSTIEPRPSRKAAWLAMGAVALALGEIDPHYAGKVVILAYQGGQPPSSAGSLRLIVPGDAHGGRNVRDVVRIEVK